ncbi:MAG TPA: carboxypeptidase regulatory-like domain-containing protein, partial [Conexibacter sp.]|nr:carboxypeptidase regulatory-like domain-containing protein [Conexibacter sp.]
MAGARRLRVTRFRGRRRGSALAAIGLLALVTLAADAHAATIRGTVLDGASAPVVSAYVTVYTAEEEPTYVSSSFTSSSGQYEIGALPAGTYKVRFHPPVGTGANLMPQWYDGKSDADSADSVALAAAGSIAQGIDARLLEGAHISGRVTAQATGAPLPDAYIDVYDEAGDWVALAEADADGRYRVNGLATGSYRVSASAGVGDNYVAEYYDDAPTFEQADPVAAVAGEEQPGIDFALRPGGRVAGHVADAETGEGLGDISVYVTAEDGATAYGSSDEDGDYVVNGVASGRQTVGFHPSEFPHQSHRPQWYDGKSDVEQADPISVTEGQLTSGIDAALDPAGRITGTVTGRAGQPLAGVRVELYEAGRSWSSGAVRTDENGRYRVTGLEPGSYRLGFRDPSGVHRDEYHDDAATLAAATAITLGDGELVDGIDARLETSGRITGRVTAADGGAGIRGVVVLVYAGSGVYLGSTTTGADGRYTATGLMGGTYRLNFLAGMDAPEPPPSPGGSPDPTGPDVADYASEWFDDQPSIETATAITVTAGEETPDIDAQLAQGGSIEGRIAEDGSGTPLPGIIVAAYAADGSWTASTSSDPSGRYTLRGLPSGSYRLRYWANDGGPHVSEYYDDAATVDDATLVTVATGQTTTVPQVGLARGGTIAGRVVDDAGTPAAGAYVSAYEQQTGDWVGSAEVGPDGSYTVRGLRTGSYRVSFGGGAYRAEWFDDADYLSADPVAVTAGELTADIDATLLRAVSIAGSVTDVRTGAPLSGVDVIAYDDASGYGYLVTTGFDGRYRISGLAPGSYRVRFEKPGSGYAERWYDGADSSATATVVRLAGGEQRSGIDAALVSGGGITGRATDAVTGAPVAGMTVIAFTEAGLTAAYGNTRLDGSYALDGLVTGSYHVSFRPADGLNYIAGWYGGDTRAEAVSVAVTHGETTAGIDRELHAGGRVTGVVRDAETGDPVANVSVNASGSIAGESHSGYVTSGPDGRFTVAGLPTGAFRLSFSPSGDGFLLDAARENVAVTAQQDTTLGDVGLAAGGRIAGTVLDHASGAPRLGATVMATSSSGTSRLAWSGADGRYSLGALPPGRYTVRFDDYNGYGTQWFDRSPTAGGAATVTVTARAVTPQIDASLARPPLSTSPPTIAGTTTQGQTLTATDGTWSGDPTAVTRQWLRCLAEEDYCWEIAGATQSTYTLGESDGGYRIAVAETAVNLGGTTTERSQLTDVVVPQPPLNTWAPSISGTPRSGEQLYASVGGWANNPTSYSYRWQRCNAFGSACAVIDSETDDWYTVRDADIGHTLTVVLIARNAGGESEPVVSTPSTAIVPAVPANLAAPTISGAPRQGERLTAEHGSWSGAPSGYDYSWRRCDAAGANCITSGSGSTYSLRAADVGRRIVVVVRAANAGGTSQPASSAPTDAVIASRPQSTDPPRISGIAKVGETLAASSGDWSNEPTSYTYSWLACPPDSACAPIAGATRTTYVPTESDVGNALVVRVTASNPAGAGTAATSAATDPVRARIPVNITRPSISGTAVEGATLTLVRGSWSEQPSSYEQQWWRCAASGSCTEIAGATGTQHLLGAADIGFRIVVRERAVNASGVSVAAVSDETATVAAGRPLNSVLPEIAGSAREGASLNAGNGSWTNAPIGFAYQWLSCATALDCRAIADATDQRYEARYADVGRRLMVEVTASNSAGAGAPARSALTAVVTEADPPETVISEQPPARTNGATQIVRFRAVPSSAALECRLGDDPFASCAGSRQFSGLAEGDYRFEARARDAVGRVDATPATAIWTVDRTAPETTITAGPEQPVHAGAVFAFSASEAGSTFQCAVDGAVYAACVSGAALDLAGLSPGDHTLRVRAIDAAGNADASGAMRQFSFANAAPDTALTMTPDAGVIALETAAAITAADGDGDELRYTLDLGDGRVVSGHLPQAPIAHTYQRSGIYLVRLEVTDGHETDVVTRLVTVALSEPLRADAGDDLIAVAGEALTLDGSGSRPSAGIERATWEFGDGGSANGLRTTHTWGTAGTYVATLAVEAGGRRVLDSARVHVVSPAAADGLGVTVVSGGGPVAGADVLVVTPAGQRVTAVTDGAGRARLRGLADGTHTVMTYGDGYLPASAPATVSGGSGSATVSLTPGDVAEATLMHRRLNREEIIALGIDPNNPENQNVVGFTVHLNGRPFNGWLNGDGLHGPGCTRDSCQIDDPDGAGGGGTTHVQRQGRSMVSTFTLPFQARWLKEFFEIKMTIYNLAAPEFVLRDGSARLELPSGLSLAPTARGEQQTQPVGDIVGGGHASASWIVRGDAAGEYTLSADYAATLAPFGASITARATTATPLKVWGGNALRAIIESDETYRDGYPMRVRVGLRNIADIPVYDAQVELGLADEQSGYVEQPRQQRAFGAREIPAGQTRWLGPWIVIPQRSGRLDLARS